MCVRKLTCPKQSKDQSLQSMRTTRPASCPGSVQHSQQQVQPAQHQTAQKSTEALLQLKKISHRWKISFSAEKLAELILLSDSSFNSQQASSAWKKVIIQERAVSATHRLKLRGERKHECCGSHCCWDPLITGSSRACTKRGRAPQQATVTVCGHWQGHATERESLRHWMSNSAKLSLYSLSFFLSLSLSLTHSLPLCGEKENDEDNMWKHQNLLVCAVLPPGGNKQY